MPGCNHLIHLTITAAPFYYLTAKPSQVVYLIKLLVELHRILIYYSVDRNDCAALVLRESGVLEILIITDSGFVDCNQGVDLSSPFLCVSLLVNYNTTFLSKPGEGGSAEKTLESYVSCGCMLNWVDGSCSVPCLRLVVFTCSRWAVCFQQACKHTEAVKAGLVVSVLVERKASFPVICMSAPVLCAQKVLSSLLEASFRLVFWNLPSCCIKKQYICQGVLSNSATRVRI